MTCDLQISIPVRFEGFGSSFVFTFLVTSACGFLLQNIEKRIYYKCFSLETLSYKMTEEYVINTTLPFREWFACLHFLQNIFLRYLILSSISMLIVFNNFRIYHPVCFYVCKTIKLQIIFVHANKQLITWILLPIQIYSKRLYIPCFESKSVASILDGSLLLYCKIG